MIEIKPLLVIGAVVAHARPTSVVNYLPHVYEIVRGNTTTGKVGEVEGCSMQDKKRTTNAEPRLIRASLVLACCALSSEI